MSTNTYKIPISMDQRPETLLDQARWLLAERAAETAVVLIEHENEQRLSYTEFFTGAARFAGALEAAGVRPGDLVVLVLQHGEPVLSGFWGALLLGAVPSIFSFLTDKLDRARYFDSVRQMVEHSGVRVVIASPDLHAPLTEHLSGIESLAAVLNLEAISGNQAAVSETQLQEYLHRHAAQADDTAFLQHSSGSTGLQKGVMLSHRSVLNQVASYSAAINLTPEDVVVSWLPLYHDMGLIAGFIMPILQGIPLILMSPFQWVRDPKILLWAIHRHRGTLCWLPNFAYNFLATRVRPAALNDLDLSSLRAVINCSEPVYAESHRAFLEQYAYYGFRETALATCYAMAENTFAVTQSVLGTAPRFDAVDRRALMEDRRAVPVEGDVAAMTFVSCGQPIPNCEIKIVDEQRQPLPERAVGEIALRSTFMLSGYYRRPEATTDVMAAGWYFTGDMGYMAAGELYITGRKKDLIIVGGKNVYPQDIENLLNDIPGLHPGRAVAFGIFNEQLGTEDIAIVAEADAEDPEARADIMREIRGRVAQSTDVMARYVHLVGAKWLIKTSSGKVARRANREKFLSEVLNKSPEQR
ncbi:MAG TPA: AMP-binding protein [Phototrophicaceae bacterium]|nr:AMP-binding protein [Phototrophicaceae bacterium]